jgi:hypothetical protein
MPGIIGACRRQRKHLDAMKVAAALASVNLDGCEVPVRSM